MSNLRQEREWHSICNWQRWWYIKRTTHFHRCITFFEERVTLCIMSMNERRGWGWRPVEASHCPLSKMTLTWYELCWVEVSLHAMGDSDSESCVVFYIFHFLFPMTLTEDVFWGIPCSEAAIPSVWPKLTFDSLPRRKVGNLAFMLPLLETWPWQ